MGSFIYNGPCVVGCVPKRKSHPFFALVGQRAPPFLPIRAPPKNPIVKTCQPCRPRYISLIVYLFVLRMKVRLLLPILDMVAHHTYERLT